MCWPTVVVVVPLGSLSTDYKSRRSVFVEVVAANQNAKTQFGRLRTVRWWKIAGIYMLFAGLGSVRIVKNCDRGLENAARGRRPRAAFSSLRSQFFTIRTDPKPANNMLIFSSCGKLVLQITNEFVYATLSWNRLPCRLLTICKKLFATSE